MKNLIEEILGGSRSSNEQPEFVFFNDESPEGYVSQADFLASLRKQKKVKPYRIDHLKSLFDNFAVKRKLMAEPSLSNDDGEQVIWVKFSYGNMRPTLCILNQGRMLDFITDYAADRIKNVPNFISLLQSIDKE